jgi:putative ABC transport system permease protein
LGIPGVRAAASANAVPFASSGRATSFTIEGAGAQTESERPLGTYQAITAEYFDTVGFPVLRGRPFTDADNRQSPGVAIINETLAAAHFAGQDPIGRRIALSELADQSPWVTVVGVAGDVAPVNALIGTRPQIYLPAAQASDRSVAFLVRTAGDPMTTAPLARAAVWNVAPSIPVDSVRDMETIIDDDFRGGFAITGLFTVFAALSLALAATGIYGVIAYTASRRTHEIGIRLALGASRVDVFRTIVGRGIVLGVIGVVLGLLGGAAVAKLVGSQLVGVSGREPFIFAAGAGILFLVTVAAGYFPARRATRIDPMIALHHD